MAERLARAPGPAAREDRAGGACRHLRHQLGATFLTRDRRIRAFADRAPARLLVECAWEGERRRRRLDEGAAPCDGARVGFGRPVLVHRARRRASPIALALAAIGLAAGCNGPEAGWMVGPRAERRMSANQLFNLALDRAKAGDHAECERLYRRVLEKKRMAGAYANLGACLAAQGVDRRAEALAQYEAAVRAAPSAPEALLGRGLLRLAAGRRAEAEADLAQLAALGSPRARPLASALAGGPVDIGEAMFGPIETPRQAPLGIFGQ